MPKEVLKDPKQLIGTELSRVFRIAPGAVDVNTRTAEMSVTSDEPILHWLSGRGAAYVVLDHAEKSINLDRLKYGGALLENHDMNRRLGRTRDGRTDGKVLRVKARFSKLGRGAEVFDEVQEDLEHGDSPGTSAWFSVERISEKPEGYIDGFPIIRATRWTLLEVSIASVEADLRTGIGRTRTAAPAAGEEGGEGDPDPDAKEEEIEDSPAEGANKKRTITMDPIITPPAAPATPSPAQLLQTRTAEFLSIADLFGDTDQQKSAFRTMARTFALDPAKELDDLKTDMLAAMQRAQTAAAVIDPASVAASQGVVPIKRYQSLKLFKGKDADVRAYRFGMAFLANACAGHRGAEKIPMIGQAHKYAQEHGLLQRAVGQTEGSNEAGGFTVQEEWSQDFIDLREQYGVIRGATKIEPMAAETKTVLRRTGGLKFYAAGEEEEVAVSKKLWDRVGLVAKKWLCMAKMSSEITEDSIINQADDLGAEMAYAASQLEDDCGFNGDGTGSSQAETGYQGIVGIIPRLQNLFLPTGVAATRAQTAGLVVGSSTLWSGLTMDDFEAVVGLLPQYADTPNAAWFAHRTFYFTVMKKLLLAQGGATATEAANMREPNFLGYPVKFAQVLPKTTAVDQIPSVFGDPRLGTRLGNRSDLTIMLSEHSSFAADAIDIRGRIRFDFVAHDVGNAAAAAKDRKPGPIVAIVTRAS